MAHTFGIKLDPFTHDIVIENGAIVASTGNEKIAQDIKTRLRTLQGEVILDNLYGFPYKLVFQSRVLNLSEIETLLKQYILDTPNVIRIVKFFLDYETADSRKLIVEFSVESETSELITSEVSLDVWNG